MSYLGPRLCSVKVCKQNGSFSYLTYTCICGLLYLSHLHLTSTPCYLPLHLGSGCPLKHKVNCLLLQIRYKRLALLQHPLVKDFLFHKFWLLAYPLFLLYSVMYCILLILLTSFALVSPRPGPGSDTCMSH